MEATIQIIDKLAATLSELQPLKPEYQKRLDKKIRLEFNYNSNHIEGNTLTYNETELLLIFDKTTGNHELREYEEMKSHDVAFEMVKEWAADKERPLTEMALKNLHQVLLVRPFWKEAITADGQSTRRLIKVGTYKEHPNSVRLQNGEMFHYASPEDTPIQMRELIEWFRGEEEKGELHPVALAALLHYRFVRIHPFDDGNGRLSRLLMNYVLLKNNLLPVVIKTTDKKNYLFALNQADAADLNAFIRYIATQAVWSLELSIKAAKGETLEEADDLQKEIAIWKRNAVTQKVNALHRNDELVYELYTNGGIREMFESFAQQHQQFFDIFYKHEFNSYKNNSGQAGLDWLGEELDKIVLKPHPVFYEAGEAPEITQADDTYRNVWVGINLQEYKYNENNPFSIESSLRLDFGPYKYHINYNNKVLVEKNYGEYLTSEERKQIVSDCVKDVFVRIKNNSATL
jgi:Fic family protein